MASAPRPNSPPPPPPRPPFRDETYWTGEDGLTPAQAALVEEVGGIAVDVIRANAERYDADALFPTGDVAALRDAGLLTVALDRRHGGRGYGIGGVDPLALYLVIETIARISPATAHCYQVHANTCRLLSAEATDDQVAAYIAATDARGALFAGAGAEPGGGRQGTVANTVAGGYRVTGRKHYATNATQAEWIMVVVRGEPAGRDLMLMVHRRTPGLRIDAGVWNPVGMRACVSPMLYLDDCFVADEHVLGAPGAFFDDLWLARINLGFTANYLGTALGMYDWLVPYLRERTTRTNSVFQAHVGELKARIGAARLSHRHALRVSETDMHRGLLLSNEAKFLAVDALEAMIRLGNQAAGSTALFRDYPYQRLMRDGQVHLLHRRHHVGAQIVGQAELGEPYNLNLS